MNVFDLENQRIQQAIAHNLKSIAEELHELNKTLKEINGKTGYRT